MEFLAYLDAGSREIYHLVSQKTTVVENAHVCRKYDIFGYYSRTRNRLTICTDRILARETLENPGHLRENGPVNEG